MKTLKNISFLLAFACAVPAYATEQETPVAETTVALDGSEQPDVKVICDAAGKYAAAVAAPLYGLAGGAAMIQAVFGATDSVELALLAGGSTIALSVIPAIYLYNAYKTKFGEKFETLREIAKPDTFMYILPLLIGASGYFASNIAGFGGVALGTIIHGASRVLGLSLQTTLLTTFGVATAVPSYLQARNSSENFGRSSDEKKYDGTYTTVLKFTYAYAKNVAIMSFIGGAVAPILLNCMPK
jgi:hypothetical protein